MKTFILQQMGSPSMIKWSIVLVPFPFDDLSKSKTRPALCLTSEIGNFDHVIIAFISSKIPPSMMESDLILLEDTGLKVESVVRLHKLVTIPKFLIQRKLGTINDQSKSLITDKIRNLFEKA